MGSNSTTCYERLDLWVSMNMFALKHKKLDELQYCSSPLPTVCCLLCHFIVWERHVKSTLGLSPPVCELRVNVRLAALCCVSDWQSSWQHLSCPPNHRVTLWLWAATFLCASLCALVCLCAFAYVQLCVCILVLSLHVCERTKKVDGVCFVMMAVSWPDGRWGTGRICFHQFRQGRWAGNGKVIHPNLGLSMKKVKCEWVTLFTTNSQSVF